MSEDDTSRPADDPETDDPRTDRDGRTEDGPDDRGAKIPIATDDGGEDGPNDEDGGVERADGTDDPEPLDEGVEIEVRTGPPGPGGDAKPGGFDVTFGAPGGVLDRFDESFVELLSRTLDTETRLRVYVELRRRPWSTAEEIAEAAGVYPRIVREAFEDLRERDVVERRPRPGKVDESESDPDDGNGTDYEYAAAAPSALLSGMLGRASPGIELERYFGTEPPATGAERATTEESGTDTNADADTDTGPVTIDIEDDADEANEANERGETNADRTTADGNDVDDASGAGD